jgi:hypothetical protein
MRSAKALEGYRSSCVFDAARKILSLKGSTKVRASHRNINRKSLSAFTALIKRDHGRAMVPVSVLSITRWAVERRAGISNWKAKQVAEAFSES